MQVYQADGTAPSVASSSTIVSSTVASSSAAPSSAAVASLIGYISLGCYNETHDRRALNSAGTSTSSNILESCAAFCSGYSYFGVEYGAECYCENSIYVNSIKQADQSGCYMPCGGPDFLNMYCTNHTASETPATISSTRPTTTATGPGVVASAGSYQSLGCYNEVPNGRAL